MGVQVHGYGCRYMVMGVGTWLWVYRYMVMGVQVHGYGCTGT